MKTLDLSGPANYLRGDIARGLAEGDDPNIETEGGDHGVGLIRGVSVITRGEALGHYMWIDQEMLSQVAAAINTQPQGIKGRFTHPGLSSDGLGSYLGRYKNAKVSGDRVLADLHFAPSAHESPDGDLAAYVMQLAADDPQAFGTSIVFEDDPKARKEFEAQHLDEEGDFETPDKRNTKNYRHARLKELRAVDAVDSPAANPDGLFHRNQEAAADAEELLCYAFGLSDAPPKLRQLSVDPSRIERFVRSFMERHKIEPPKSQTAKGGKMAEETQGTVTDEVVEDEATTETEEIEESVTETETETVPAGETAETEEPAVAAAEMSAARAEVKRFSEAFGTNGAAWFAEGKTFEQAMQLHAGQLAEENASLKQKLAAVQIGDEDGVSFSPEDETDPKTKEEKGRFAQVLGDNVGAFAASLGGRLAPSKN